MGLFRDVQIKGWYVDQERIYEGNIHSSKKPVYMLKNNVIDTSVLGSSM